MLIIKRLFSSLFGVASNKTTSFSSNNHHLMVDNLHKSIFKEFMEELNSVSKLIWKEQKEKRESLLQDFLKYYNESELIDIFSSINLHKELPKGIKDQAISFLNVILSKKTNIELHDYVSNEENNSLARRLGAFELIDRKDKSAALTFIYRVIVDSDDPGVREVAAMGLGNIGGDVALEVLEKVQEEDPIYLEAQKSIRKIQNKMGVKQCQL